jgi:hypothetical protein
MISSRSAKPRPTHSHEFKLWRRPTSAPLLCSAELASSAAASFGISASMGFPYGLHPGILVGGTSCSVLMIRNFSLSRLISTTVRQSPMPLPALTANAVSLYVESEQETFHSVHVESAERIAAQARRAGVECLAHVSGIGSDVASSSLYIRKRGEGVLIGIFSTYSQRENSCSFGIGHPASGYQRSSAIAA